MSTPAAATDPGPELPSAIRAVADPVRSRLESVLEAERLRLGVLDADLVSMVDAVADLVLADGKRIRPAFCYWGHGLLREPEANPQLIETCTALELLHGFALMHDDVMDGSATRRGVPATHVRFADEHQHQRLIGEARRFGEGLAIVVGDYAAVLADQLMEPTPAPVRDAWSTLQVEIAAGQYLDVLHSAQPEGDLALARRIARLKSGRYTIERPLELGVLLAGGDSTLIQWLHNFGGPLGEAFQIRDDVLGAVGEPTALGKPVGDDLREGKPTVLLALARERVAAEQLPVLDQVGDPDLGDEHLHDIQTVLVESGAVAATNALVNDLRDEALATLAAPPDHVALRQGALQALAELADFVVTRDR